MIHHFHIMNMYDLSSSRLVIQSLESIFTLSILHFANILHIIVLENPVARSIFL